MQDENDSLISVSYNDRYLLSPINVALYFQLIKALKKNLGETRAAAFAAKITTTGNNGSNGNYYNYQNKVWNDWLNSSDRDLIAKLMFEEIGVNLAVNVGSKSDVGHGRIMELEFLSGKKLTVRLDQGVSFWKAAWAMRSEMIAYDFNADDAAQRDRLLGLDIDIKESDSTTQLFLKVRT